MSNPIQWYPGHMTKSVRMIEENIKAVDAVLYVLDARAPKSCINPQFDRYVAHKPVLFLINKSDLADPVATKAWAQYFTGESRNAVSFNASQGKSGGAIFPLIKEMCDAKLKKYEGKGAKATLKVMVLGVPNTGKSTVINNLCGKAKTVTGNKPGVTRGKQWVRVTDFLELLDTPGTLYPKLSDQDVARRLYFIGCIREEVVDTLDAAIYLIETLNWLYPDALQERYGAPVTASASAFDVIARARGFLLKGGETDTDRAAAALIDDFRKGRLGRLSLEMANRHFP